jgi:glycosyltransferase involved in cell wall biosynthesis
MEESRRASPRDYRTLLIAEAANPEWASVPLIGWSLSRALAQVTNTHLVTHIRNRDAVSRAGLVEGRDFTVIDNENVAGPIWKLANRLRGGAGVGWTTVTAFSAIAYYSFERVLWRQFSARITAREFDLVHRITPLSPTHQSTIAGRLAKLNVPFVIGPLNGGIPWPKNFVDRQHAEREWLSHVRGLYTLMPGYRSTRRDSAAIIAGSKYTLAEMPAWAKHKCVYIPENAVDPGRFKALRDHRATLPLKAAFVGRLVPYKGADMLLEAAQSFLQSGQLELHIVGDGPQKAQLESMVDRLGVRNNVTFHGWVAHDDVQYILQRCDMMLLPSVREFGGGVVIESMAVGVAPIVADYGGPAELVDDATGIRVGFESKQSLIDGFRQALADVIAAPEKLDHLGAAGREKVRAKLTWEAKARQIVAVYDAVLEGRNDLSALGFK